MQKEVEVGGAVEGFNSLVQNPLQSLENLLKVGIRCFLIY